MRFKLKTRDINKIQPHRTFIIAVIWLIILNIFWWIIQFKPFSEWPAIRNIKALERDNPPVHYEDEKHELINIKKPSKIIINQQVIHFNRFFTSIDSLAAVYLPKNLNVPGDLVLVSANSWILDSLRRTDYKEALNRGRFIYDLDKQVIIPAGAPIRIPDSLEATLKAQALLATRLVLNIPEFKLRLIRGSDTILTAPVRVGRNEKLFLEAVGREVDLRTPIGQGHIYKVWRKPKSVNLHTGEEYKVTRRDDNQVTKMPPIPSLEPEINGHRIGKMIHATTNPITLGKAFSHGCVGVSEADMWMIYFNMPVGAQVEFRYDLKSGDKTFQDVYRRAAN